MGSGLQNQPCCVPGLPAPSAALREALFQDHTASSLEAAGVGRDPRTPGKGPPGLGEAFEISYPSFPEGPEKLVGTQAQGSAEELQSP